MKKVKNLILAAYDGNLGANRRFVFEVNVNAMGDVSVHNHECDVEGSEDELTVGDLVANSAWKKQGKALTGGEGIHFMAKHNTGVAKAVSEEELISVLDDTILNYPGEEALFFGITDRKSVV